MRHAGISRRLAGPAKQAAPPLLSGTWMCAVRWAACPQQCVDLAAARWHQIATKPLSC